MSFSSKQCCQKRTFMIKIAPNQYQMGRLNSLLAFLGSSNAKRPNRPRGEVHYPFQPPTYISLISVSVLTLAGLCSRVSDLFEWPTFDCNFCRFRGYSRRWPISVIDCCRCGAFQLSWKFCRRWRLQCWFCLRRHTLSRKVWQKLIPSLFLSNALYYFTSHDPTLF